MPISSQDDVSLFELLRIIGVSSVAALRRGELTEAQMEKIDRIVEKAQAREGEKREIRAAARDAYNRTRREARKKKAVDKAVARAKKKSGWW